MTVNRKFWITALITCGTALYLISLHRRSSVISDFNVTSTLPDPSAFTSVFQHVHVPGTAHEEGTRSFQENLSQVVPFQKPTSEIQEILLSRSRKAKLFNFLFSSRFQPELLGNPEILHLIRQRFSSPYPLPSAGHHTSEYEEELISRIGIMKALGQVHVKKLKEFYEIVLRNDSEHWIVKRQTLKNFQKLDGFESETQRNELLSAIDGRAVTLAGFSDTEMIEKVLTHGKEE